MYMLPFPSMCVCKYVCQQVCTACGKPTSCRKQNECTLRVYTVPLEYRWDINKKSWICCFACIHSYSFYVPK